MKKSITEQIGILLIIISLTLSVLGIIAESKSLESVSQSRNAILLTVGAFFSFLLAVISLWKRASLFSILSRTALAILLITIAIMLIPNQNFASLLIIVIWSCILVASLSRKPKTPLLVGLVLVMLGLGSFIAYLLICNFLPHSSDLFGLILILLSITFIIVGVSNLVSLPEKLVGQKTNRIFTFLFSLFLLLGIMSVIPAGIRFGWLGVLGVLGWTGALGTIIWVFYKVRYSRLYVIWVLMSVMPWLGVGALTYINANSRQFSADFLQLCLAILLTIVALVVVGFFSPIGMMGVFRIPNRRDLVKYLFPTKLSTPQPTNKAPAKNQTGFTLIELLIVIAIVAIISAGVVHLFGFAMLGSKHLEFQNKAVFLAQSELERLRSQSIPRNTNLKTLPISNRLNRELKSLPDSQGQITVSKFKDTPLKEIRVNIQWSEGTRQHSVQMTTLLGANEK